jgi:AraC-like DNA-binding protein
MDRLTFVLHNLTVTERHISAYARYLPAEVDALRWGLHLVDCGFTEVPSGSDYPIGQHPSEYLFSWENGRTLQEYQLVYITKGRGLFESEQTGRVRIQAGHVLLLFPGIWHRYRPVKTVGWDESWIGFGGDYADRIMHGFFPPDRAVIRVGYDENLLHHMRATVDLMQAMPAGYAQLLAARVVDALARVRSLSMSYSATDRETVNKLQQARCFLLDHSAEPIDMRALAKRLGLSYSRFRSMFKAHTGAAPHQYQLDIRTNKARDLLTGTNLTITEIADRLGFSSVYYFSRLFKKREGVSPRQYRER